jgi:histidinol-phosphate aminotransferase
MYSDLEGYTPGEQLNDPRIIKLNTNENPYPLSPRVLDAIRGLDESAFRKYPDPVSTAFRSACASRYGYPGPEWVIAGNGMDELLALVLRTFVDPGDTVLATYPTYSLYEVLCELHGAKITYVDLDGDYQMPDAMFSTPARLCFLSRPNAPTGVPASRDAVARLCASFDGIVVIDEAYADFADDNCMDFAGTYENVIVMRTFSKSFSLAGMRIGTAVARPELISEFLKTKDSYNMDVVSQAAGLAAMEDYAHMEANVAKIRATRARLSGALTELGFDVAPSQSNFVLARWGGTPSAQRLFEQLRERLILLRYFDAPGLRDALRISIGTDAECDKLILEFSEIIR